VSGTRDGAMGDSATTDAKSADMRCVHCGETHPVAFTHCPRTGRPIAVGSALIGRVFANRYKMVGLLGEGGMGAVYVAEDVLIGRKVAIKRLHPELASDANAVARFHREARAAAATRHDNIVEVLDLGFAEDHSPYLVMEYLKGQSLSLLLRREQRIAPARACYLVGQVLDALSAVHRRHIIHRDLKPDNVFITRRRGRPDHVKVLDFGVSKMWREDGGDQLSLTRTGVMLGTPYYMSPEQARGVRAHDHRADLYAVGVILYECLTSRPPFDGPNYHALLQAILGGKPPPLRELAPDVDGALAEVVAKSIARDPNARFQSAREMLSALIPFGAVDPGASDDDTGMDSQPPPSVQAIETEMGRTELVSTELRAPTTPADTARSSSPGPAPAGAASAHARGAEPPPPAPAAPRVSAGPVASGSAGGARARPRPADSGRGDIAKSERPRADRVAEQAAPVVQVVAAAASPWPSPAVARPRSMQGPGRAFVARSRDWVEPIATDTPEPGPITVATSTSTPSRPFASTLPTPARARVAPMATPLEVPATGGTHVKGSLLLAAVQHLEHVHGRTLFETIMARLSPEVRGRIGGMILPMAWFPVTYYEALLAAVERAIGPGNGVAAMEVGAATANRELPTTHRVFMQTATPAMAIDRLPQLWRSYHSGGDLVIDKGGTGTVRVEARGLQPDTFLHAMAMTGFYQRLLDLTGAKDVRATLVSSRGRGDERTVTTLRWR